jgi:hypothetical protein
MTAFRFSSACGPTGGHRQRKQTKRQCAAASTGRSSEQRQRQQTERACVLLSNSSVGRRLVAPRELRLSSEDVVQRACGAADTRTYRLDDLAIRHQCLRQQRLELRGLVGHDPAAVRRGLLLHLPSAADRAQRRAAEKNRGRGGRGNAFFHPGRLELFSSHRFSSRWHQCARCGPACRHRCCRCCCCCWRAPP